jgi:hypothetical protein
MSGTGRVSMPPGSASTPMAHEEETGGKNEKA